MLRPGRTSLWLCACARLICAMVSRCRCERGPKRTSTIVCDWRAWFTSWTAIRCFSRTISAVSSRRPTRSAAWVAELDGQIIGHVALRSSSSAAVVAMASEALRLPADRLGVVARLLVSPQHRRHGTGRSLLEVACGHAHARGLWPILDVVTHQQGAIALYDKCGWTRAGQVTSRYGDDVVLDEFVYLGPRPPVD